MDDPYLDARSSRRVWEDRPRGPFEVNESLPKPVQLWRDQTNKSTNKPQELLHFGWQHNSAQRILESLELHSYEWTVKAIKTRECLDEQDRRDIAVSILAMSRNRPLLPLALILRALILARLEDDTLIFGCDGRTWCWFCNRRRRKLSAVPKGTIALLNMILYIDITSHHVPSPFFMSIESETCFI